MAWDGKERRKSGNREELRERIRKLQRDFEAEQVRPGKQVKQRPLKSKTPRR